MYATITVCFVCVCIAFLVCAVGFAIDSYSSYMATKETRKLNEKMFNENVDEQCKQNVLSEIGKQGYVLKIVPSKVNAKQKQIGCTH